MGDITDADLDRLLESLDKATPGYRGRCLPGWHWRIFGEERQVHGMSREGEAMQHVCTTRSQSDAVLITEARNALRPLVEEVRRLRAETDQQSRLIAEMARQKIEARCGWREEVAEL